MQLLLVRHGESAGNLTRRLQSRINDASEPFGSVLDKALGALSDANESLEHVLDHISFMRTQGNKRILSDDACKDLVRHFSKHRLRNEDFQFSDLLGAAYEFLINMFAESAGKKGGDFYTPRDVIRLMVRILKPAPGMGGHQPGPDEHGRAAHQHEARNQKLLATDSVAIMSEDQTAQRPRQKAKGPGRICQHCADERIFLLKELTVEDQRGGGSVQEEVVPLDRGADKAGQHDLTQHARRARKPSRIRQIDCRHSIPPTKLSGGL